MTCRDVEDRVEAMAAGDEPVSAPIRAHLEECLACAGAFARAQTIERALASRPAPDAPASFTRTVVGRIRGDRWRIEQRVDWLFNAAVLVGFVAVVGGVAALMNLGDLTRAVGSGFQMLTNVGARVAAEAVPTLSTYIISAALLGTTMAVWWWAERRWTL